MGARLTHWAARALVRWKCGRPETVRGAPVPRPSPSFLFSVGAVQRGRTRSFRHAPLSALSSAMLSRATALAPLLGGLRQTLPALGARTAVTGTAFDPREKAAEVRREREGHERQAGHRARQGCPGLRSRSIALSGM